MYETDREQEATEQHRDLYSGLRGDLDEKEIRKRGGMCKRVADSLCCTAETNATL